jgi:hypothetical protein
MGFGQKWVVLDIVGGTILLKKFNVRKKENNCRIKNFFVEHQPQKVTTPHSMEFMRM